MLFCSVEKLGYIIEEPKGIVKVLDSSHGHIEKGGWSTVKITIVPIEKLYGIILQAFNCFKNSLKMVKK